MSAETITKLGIIVVIVISAFSFNYGMNEIADKLDGKVKECPTKSNANSVEKSITLKV